MSTDTNAPLLPDLPLLDHSLGAIGFLLRLIESQHKDDPGSKEGYRLLAGRAIANLASRIEAAAGDPSALAEIVTEIRSLIPEPVQPLRYAVRLWIGRGSGEMLDLDDQPGRYISVVMSKAPGEEPPTPEHDTHDPKWCGWIDIGEITVYPWDAEDHKYLDILRCQLARQWAVGNGLPHAIYSSWNAYIAANVVEHPNFQQRVIRRETMGVGLIFSSPGGYYLKPAHEEAVVPLEWKQSRLTYRLVA